MPSQVQVRRLLDAGLDYRAIAVRLGIPPGQAYLIATGLPADGGDAGSDADTRRPGYLPTSTQHLANPPVENPTSEESVDNWMKQRAFTDHPMRTAASRRDAAPGAHHAPGRDHDVHTVLTRDHDNVTAMVEQLETIPGCRKGGSRRQLEQRKSIVDMITVALSRHESVEQEWFWPAVRGHLAQGQRLAEQGLAQEQDGKDLLVALGRLDPAEDEFDELVEKLVLALRKHVAFEDLVLLRLRDAMPRRARGRLGRKLRLGERLAPTRPHAHAPKQPAIAVKVAGLPAAITDRMRDAVGSRPADRRGRAG